MATPVSSNRRARGLDIAKAASIEENPDGSFSVPSQSVPEIAYRVMPQESGYACNCPEFAQRRTEVGECKHCHAVRFWIAARVELQAKPRPRVFADDAVQCPKCGSIRVIRFGVSRKRQAFRCNDCQNRFRESALLKGSRYTPEMVSPTLDLYFSGTSLRKTAKILNSHFGTRMGPTSIYRWIQKFVPRITEYAQPLTPELSGDWHADEVFVRMKNGINYKAHYGGEAKNIAFLWNVMDRKPRFLLASKVSTWRDVAGADRAYREALRNAGGNRSEAIYTDALKSYQTLMASLPESERPQHIAKAGIRKPNATNNRIERLNGTIRERTKVQRGWKNPASKIAEWQRIHYNFVKPHQALAGQTPAERASVGVEGEGKWLGLLRAALTTPRGTGA